MLFRSWPGGRAVAVGKSNLNIKTLVSGINSSLAGEKSNYGSSGGYQLRVMSPLTELFTYNWIHSSKSWRLLLRIIKYSGIRGGPRFFLVAYCALLATTGTYSPGAEPKILTPNIIVNRGFIFS